MKKLVIALVCILLVVGVVGGTLAWLTDTSDTVTNVFTTSDINITLTESEGLDLQMIPGWTITKDPKVTVKAGSEKCWLFVKVDESANFDNFMTYTIAEGWTAGEGSDEGKNGVPVGVYFRIVETGISDQDFPVIKDNTVTVKSEVTKEMMNVLKAEGATQPKLTITAYATQLYKTNGVEFDVDDAWAIFTATP